MLLIFTRLDASRYVSRITRADGVAFMVNGVGHMFQIPHDLAHFAVESALQLPNGFWGSVAAGAVLPSMTHIGGRRKPRAEERSSVVLKTNAAHLGEAEVLVRIFNTACEKKQSDSELRRLLADRRMSPEHSIHQISDAQVAAVRAAWAEINEKWRHLQIGGELRLSWPERGEQRRSARPAKAARVGGYPSVHNLRLLANCLQTDHARRGSLYIASLPLNCSRDDLNRSEMTMRALRSPGEARVGASHHTNDEQNADYFREAEWTRSR